MGGPARNFRCLELSAVLAHTGTQMNDEQFTKLYKYMTKRFDELEASLDTKADRNQVDRLYTLLDQHVTRQEVDDQERLAMTSQLDRHEGWIKQVAGKTGTKLVPEQ